MVLLNYIYNKKAQFLWAFLLLLSNNIKAQNFVPNPSFEQLSIPCNSLTTGGGLLIGIRYVKAGLIVNLILVLILVMVDLVVVFL